MSTYDEEALRGRHRFAISTKFIRDFGIEAPVSGATQLVAARGHRGRLELFSIGTDQRIHHFSRDFSGTWTRLRLPWKASSLAVVPQRDGSDKVFFADFVVDEKRTVTVYELENAGREPQRLLVGRFVTTDPKVYGLGELSGLQCRNGSNILVTSLAARSGAHTSSWVVLFGHGSSTGALSLGEGKGVVARKVLVANEDPGSTRWPHMSFVLMDENGLRVEWGKRSGVLLQSERIPIPELLNVVEIDVARDHRGYLRIFALDRDHRIHVLCQTGGGGSHPPRWTSTWMSPDTTLADGSRPTFHRIFALRQGQGDLVLFALDTEDRLWSISEEDAGTIDGWGRLEELGVRAAHLAVASTDESYVEVFAVSRQNELFRLSKSRRGENWHCEKVGWDASDSEKILHDVYRTGLTIFDEHQDTVAGVPIRVTATEKIPSTVNGLTYTLGPGEPVLAETNAFGKICVTFELTEKKRVPSLSFEAGFLDNGLLDVCPERKAHIYLKSGKKPAEQSWDSRSEMYLIPEDTVIEQA